MSFFKVILLFLPLFLFLAGFITWIASPICEASAIEFSRTLGEVIYVGAGAMVVWATPLVEFYGPRVTRVSEFFVMVSEGPERRKWRPGRRLHSHRLKFDASGYK